MPKVIADITMSLDGYVTGQGADEKHGLGNAPELHTWVMKKDKTDADVLERATAESGAVIMGRRLFDTVDAPEGWSEKMGYGADQAATPPFFVITHEPPRDVRLERELGMHFTFVSDLETAIEKARAAATHGDVVIMGGGDVIGQALEHGLVDELRIHLAHAARRRHAAVQTGHTSDVPPARCPSVEERHPPRLRAGVISPQSAIPSCSSRSHHPALRQLSLARNPLVVLFWRRSRRWKTRKRSRSTPSTSSAGSMETCCASATRLDDADDGYANRLALDNANVYWTTGRTYTGSSATSWNHAAG